MLSVYYDFQILLAQRYGGISRYVYEVASRLPKFGAEAEISCIHNHNHYFRDKFGLVDMSKSNKLLRLAELGTYFYVNRVKTFFELKRRHYDIVHPTYYYAFKPKHGKFIITVHDMTHEKYSGIYPVNRRVIAAKKKMVHQADRIIAVSMNTKRDIIDYYPDVDPAKISVIHHGALGKMSVQEGKAESFSYMNGHDYILFVGMRGMYKNFARFFEAVRPVLAGYKELHIFCAGGGAFTGQEHELFGEYASRVHQAGLSDSELAAAYSNALCFVFPSEYEGFGIPILEAFACGCPVVCSNTSSLPEVAGECAEYFDPVDIDGMSEAILRVIEDSALRQKLSKSGRERLKIFDWDKTAREHIACYEEAISND